MPFIRLIALYLPQFHPIPENDRWWGKGFTEWTNVAKATPLFKGHYQPHIPADLGFYDLRMPEVRAAQAEMAREYGIEGFCYWHYWLEGRRLLDLPFREVLHSGEPDFPFCLAWANHTWSRSWLADNREVLLEQTYSDEDDRNHIRWLMEAFADKRYLRVKGRPLFLIYNPNDLPDARRTTDTFRSECMRQGLVEPYLIGMNGRRSEVDAQTLGFDATLDHQPQLGVLPSMDWEGISKSKLLRNLKYRVVNAQLNIYDYSAAVRWMTKKRPDYPAYPCVFVGWDNTPRRGDRAWILMNSTPEKFRAYLSTVVQETVQASREERLVFLNAWNEWGEGMHLEPDLKYGRGFLEAIQQVVAARK